MAGDVLKILVDPDGATGRVFTDLELKNLPFASMQAANATAFGIRQKWADTMPRVFDRPTPLTQRAIVYEKATKAKPFAVVKVRDEAFKGTPPSRYLQAQVKGGPRLMKPFENRLAAQGILPAGMQAVPGKGVDLDGFGNIAGSTMNRVLSQLGARFDPLQNETDTSRARRQKREAKQRRGDYFAVKQKRGGLRPGIYQRVRTGFGSAVRSILAFVRPASYKPRYRIFDLAERMYPRLFAFHFENELRKAVETSKFRGRA
mgnify:CR=1 FL=1